MIERRSTDDRWSRVALFGTAGEAAQNIDLLIAMHGGELADYRVARVGPKRWIAIAGWITLGIMVVVTVAAWIALAAA